MVWNVTIPLAAVAVVLASLRFYVRACLVRVVGKDDWLLLAAVIFLCGAIGGELWAVSLGIGRHQYDLVRDPTSDPRKILPVCYSFLEALMLLIDVSHIY